MRPILHHTKKYDGTVHYRFAANVVLERSNVLVIYRGPGVPVESYRGAMVADNHLLVQFYGHRHHNVAVMWHADWTPHMHYVNVATPARWDRGAVTAVDLDLDVFRRQHEGRIVVDDEDEFEENMERYEYPDDLVATCRRELEYIQAAMADRAGPLSDEVFSWRPGAHLDESLIGPA